MRWPRSASAPESSATNALTSCASSQGNGVTWAMEKRSGTAAQRRAPAAHPRRAAGKGRRPGQGRPDGDLVARGHPDGVPGYPLVGDRGDFGSAARSFASRAFSAAARVFACWAMNASVASRARWSGRCV